jgi:glutamate synthase (NADPH/NADH) small chain
MVARPRGFIEIERAPAAARPLLERIRDWRETGVPLPEATLREQGARCMDCGVPFCHTGAIVNGAALGCPVNNLIPEWNELVARGQWREAYLRLAATNDFPEVTGRVCPAPCEGSCTVGLGGKPVTIKSLEAAIVDRAFAEGWARPEPPATRSGRSVAVVGSGPAGLAAASQLNRRGHRVTVYERADRVGGLLMYGIPAMKLAKELVERRVELLHAEGIAFQTGAEVGRDLDPAELLDRFDAVVLATGATVARDLAVPGRDLPGIHLAVDYLRGATRAVLAGEGGGPATAPISAAGRDVVVIGGGDTGTDCVATAIRQGARSLVQLEILPRPPDERVPDNPWPQWPRVHRVDYGQEEAAAIWGADPRAYAVATRRFVAGPDGRLAGVEIVDVAWEPGPDGRIGPAERSGTERTLPAGLVLLALGFVGPERSLPEALGCALDARGNVLADEGRRTSVPGVFAAGDCRRGQSLVVWAIREGRRAAQGVDEHLAALERATA